MKHSCLVNGYDSLNLTKLDVLDDLPEIKIGIKYRLKGGEIAGFPGRASLPCLAWAVTDLELADLDALAETEVEYVTLPGWQASIQGVHQFEDLPLNCQAYIKFIEDFLGVPVEWIGTGPGRDDMIHRK